MTVNVNDIIASLPPDRQAKIEARAAELIAEEIMFEEADDANREGDF